LPDVVGRFLRDHDGQGRLAALGQFNRPRLFGFDARESGIKHRDD
jgi:hypothetical protein